MIKFKIKEVPKGFIVLASEGLVTFYTPYLKFAGSSETYIFKSFDSAKDALMHEIWLNVLHNTYL